MNPLTTPYPLGRVVEHDARSWDFQARRVTPSTQPVLWRHYGSVLNQGQLGSCTGNAMTQCMMTAPFRQRGRNLKEADAVKCYELATTLDNAPGQYPPTDTGSSSLGAAKAAQQLGWITSYTHAFGIAHAQQAIGVGPFIVGSEWLEGMFIPDANGFVPLTGAVAGGHEWLMLGWDPRADVWTAQNSWGRAWGIKGRFLLHGSDFANLLNAQGDVLAPVA